MTNTTGTGGGSTRIGRRPLASFFALTSGDTHEPRRSAAAGDMDLRRLHSAGITVPDAPTPSYLHSTLYSVHAAYAPLPSCWSLRDKSSMVAVIGEDASEAHYTGAGKNDSDAAAIRANVPIPPHVPVYYFEVEVVSKGKEGFIGIGVCGGSVNLGRLPGWEKDSWGYHGDDGYLFNGTGVGRTYGPMFTLGDVIGVLVLRHKKQLAFTKNGVLIGTAFSNLPAPGVGSNVQLYPTVGFRTAGEQVRVNFGARPFVFPIEMMLKEEQASLQSLVRSQIPPSVSIPTAAGQHVAVASSNAATLDLILEYLIHRGYAATAKALSDASSFPPANEPTTQHLTRLHRSWKDILHAYGGRVALHSHPNGQTSTLPFDDVSIRANIMKLVRGGQIDAALEQTRSFYSSAVLDNRPDLLFAIRCRKFVELVRERSLLVNDGTSDAEDEDEFMDACEEKPTSGESGEVDEIEPMMLVETGTSSRPASETCLPIQTDGRPSSSGLPDEEFHTAASSPAINMFGSNLQYPPGSPHSRHFASQSISSQMSSSSGARSKQRMLLHLHRDIMHQGRSLRNDYKHDTRPEIRRMLMETFSIQAYAKPESSPVAYVLDPERREVIALALNAAILAESGRGSMSKLEELWRHTVVAQSVLVAETSDAGGMAGLVNVGEELRVINTDMDM